MLAQALSLLDTQPDNRLVRAYCCTRMLSNEAMADVMTRRGHVGSDLYNYFESCAVRAQQLRWEVLAALACRPTECAIAVAFAMNIETNYTDRRLKQRYIDLDMYSWWPPTIVSNLQKYSLFFELDSARAANIAAAWSNGSATNNNRFIGSIACCDPPAIYTYARTLKGTPEYWNALRLAMVLGDRDAVIDWNIEHDSWTQIERIDWHPRAKFFLMQRSTREYDMEDYKELVRAGCSEARKVVGDMLIAQGHNDSAADWYGHEYYALGCHARIIPAIFGPIKVLREREYIRVIVEKQPAVRFIISARFHLKKALRVKVTAPEVLRETIKDMLSAEEVIFEPC